MEGSKIEIVIVEEQVDVIDVACDLSLGLVNEQTISSLSGQLSFICFQQANMSVFAFLPVVFYKNRIRILRPSRIL